MDGKMTDRIELGDVIIFQGITIPPKEGEGFMPTIPITLERVEGFSEDGSMLKFKNNDDLQPKYRVRTLLRDGERYQYAGFSQLAIFRDEGDITDEAFEKMLEFEATGKIE